MKNVSLLGYRALVPASWQVVDLRATPAACVRFDLHAVYLGAPGSAERCPPHLSAAKTEAFLVEPLGPLSPASRPVADTVAHQSLVTDATAGVQVTATYGSNQILIKHILDSASVIPERAPTAPADPADPSPRAPMTAAPSPRAFTAAPSPLPSTPSPLPSPSRLPTPSPLPTKSPSFTLLPLPTLFPLPTASPLPTPSRLPTPSPLPTPVPLPTPLPRPPAPVPAEAPPAARPASATNETRPCFDPWTAPPPATMPAWMRHSP